MRRFLFDGHVLDIDRRELYQGIEPVVLAPLVFDLLTCLVMNRDRVVSKADLLVPFGPVGSYRNPR